MVRKPLGLFACLILLGSVSAAPGQKAILSWHGQSFFSLLTSKGTRIVIDPHAIEVYGRNVVKADLILISHFHNDHTQINVVENFKKAKTITGLKGTPRKADWNAVDMKFKDVHVRTVGTYHDTTQGMERGKNGIFIIEVDGMRFVHLGDLGHVLTKAQIEKIGPVDVLMIPVGGIYTINGAEAQKVVEQLKPKKYILPMHYGTKVFDDVLGPEEFLDGQKKENVRRTPNLNKLVVDSAFKPAEPVTVLLGWK